MTLLDPDATRSMLMLQNRMNEKINPHWLNARYPFLRAVMVEAVEALEHFGWKWWKAQQPDIPQLRIELIDIWHFLLSHYLILCAGDTGAAADRICAEWQGPTALRFDDAAYDIDALDIRQRLELLAALAAARRVCLPLFAVLLADTGMNPRTLHREYVSKNVLNHFRQDHGYRDGSYLKIWDGREDNEHLAELWERLDHASAATSDDLYRALETRYATVTGRAAR